METSLVVRRAGLDEADAVTDAFVAGGVDEVGMTWAMEDHPDFAEQFRTEHAPDLIRRTLREDEVWVAGVGQEIWTVALWHTVTNADRYHREAAEMGELFENFPVQPLRRLAALTATVAQHHPTEFPHHYLHVIVTVPHRRGHGAGGALVAARLEAAADTGIPAYLEASTERSARLYARCGFARIGKSIPLPENGPVLLPMWRVHPANSGLDAGSSIGQGRN